VEILKVSVMVVNHDGLSKEELAGVIEHTHYPNDAISPRVSRIDSREVEWTDDHPLNHKKLWKQAFRKLFRKEG
jgi:hypothetical protein